MQASGEDIIPFIKMYVREEDDDGNLSEEQVHPVCVHTYVVFDTSLCSGDACTTLSMTPTALSATLAGVLPLRITSPTQRV